MPHTFKMKGNLDGIIAVMVILSLIVGTALLVSKKTDAGTVLDYVGPTTTPALMVVKKKGTKKILFTDYMPSIEECRRTRTTIRILEELNLAPPLYITCSEVNDE